MKDIIEAKSTEIICTLDSKETRIRVEEFINDVLVKTWFDYNQEHILAMKQALLKPH